MAIYPYLIPKLYVDDIYKVPYESLKKQGIKALLFDLDNTIIDYTQTKLELKTIEFLNHLSNDFKIIIISNSMKKRVYLAVGHHFDFISFARKPFKIGFKQALKKLDLKDHEIAMIGDQLMTDIYGANRLGFYTVLVDAVKRKTDKLPTRINRLLERYYLKKLKVKRPLEYDEVLKAYANKQK